MNDKTRSSTVKPNGFTLIELMIVLAILGLLGAIALPAYTSQMAKAHRADARGQLLQASQFMQRFYAANDSFKTDRQGNAVLGQMPQALLQSPAQGTAIYELSIPATLLNDVSFTLQMTPVAGGKMATDECGSFTLTATGIKGVGNTSTPGSTTLRDKCWK